MATVEDKTLTIGLLPSDWRRVQSARKGIPLELAIVLLLLDGLEYRAIQRHASRVHPAANNNERRVSA